MAINKMEVGKQQATHALSQLGSRVQHDPVADGRTAGLLVSDDEAEYLIEVKDKSEAESLVQRRRDVLAITDGRVVDGDPAEVEWALLGELEEIESKLSSDHPE